MPDENVFDVLPRIRKQRPKLPVIVMSAQNTLLTAVNAAEIGAFDYIPKPFDLDDMTATARRALARPADGEAARAQARADARRAPAADRPLGADAGGLPHHRPAGRRRPDGADPRRIRLRQGAGRPARCTTSAAGATASSWSINLAAVPRERVETELFGKGDGDFGKLVEADGGTLFLDEIGDMPLDAQTRLLRVFDGAEPAINPRTGRKPNVRVIAATNRDLRGLIREGLFREDLYFRLNVAPVRLPPLRERTEDIPDLARAFLLRANREGLPAKTIDAGALERLKAHAWPGNVRELENLIRRICALYAEEMITARIVERELSEQATTPPGEDGAADPVDAGRAAPGLLLRRPAGRRAAGRASTTGCWRTSSGR